MKTQGSRVGGMLSTQHTNSLNMFQFIQHKCLPLNMFLRRQMLIADRATFGAKMEQAAGEPTRTCLTEDIPKVSIDTKKG